MNQQRGRSYESVCIVVMLGTLFSLAAVCLYLVVSAFRIGTDAGIRSMAGILLPVVIGGFLAVFRREVFARAAGVRPAIAFAVALLFGVAMMLLLRHIETLRFAPITEFVVASGLTVLLYAPGSMPGIVRDSTASDTWMAYYFGMVTGMLGYIVLAGFPVA